MTADPYADLREETARASGERNNKNGNYSKPNGAQARWIKASEHTPRPPRWLWENYLLVAQFNLLGGDPDVGKSYLSMKMATHVTTGSPWPDGSPCPKGAAVLLCGEDSKDTIVSRLQLMGADLTQVSILEGIEVSREDEDPLLVRLSLTRALHVAEIESRVRETGALLVIVDPIDTHLESTTRVKDGPGTRSYTNPLADLAERTDAAVLAVAHLNKNEIGQALYRISGSIDLIAAARSALAVGREPESENDRRLLLPLKCNLTAKPPGRGYTISATDGVVWDQQPVTVDAAQMLGGGDAHATEKVGKREQAERILRAILAQTPQMPEHCYGIARAVGTGISESTIDRAKKDLGVQSQQVTHPDGSRHWYWHLPDTPWHPDTLTPCTTTMAQDVRVSGTQPHAGEETCGEEVEADPWDTEVQA